MKGLRRTLFQLGMLFLSALSSQNSSADEVSTIASRFGLTHEIKGDPLVHPGVHRIYTDPRLDRAILVLDRLEGKKEARIEERNGYLLVEFTTSDNTYVSLAAVGI